MNVYSVYVPQLVKVIGKKENVWNLVFQIVSKVSLDEIVKSVKDVLMYMVALDMDMEILMGLDFIDSLGLVIIIIIIIINVLIKVMLNEYAAGALCRVSGRR